LRILHDPITLVARREHVDLKPTVLCLTLGFTHRLGYDMGRTLSGSATTGTGPPRVAGVYLAVCLRPSFVYGSLRHPVAVGCVVFYHEEVFRSSFSSYSDRSMRSSSSVSENFANQSLYVSGIGFFKISSPFLAFSAVCLYTSITALRRSSVSESSANAFFSPIPGIPGMLSATSPVSICFIR